jgi:hypothetical protein
VKILAASTDPEFATKIRMPLCTIDLAETGESVLQLFEANTYQGASGNLKVPQNWQSESGGKFSSHFLNFSF